jgi:non-homologous end joining protein Ku
MARQLIDAMSGPWKPADYRDTYTDRVNDGTGTRGRATARGWRRGHPAGTEQSRG